MQLVNGYTHELVSQMLHLCAPAADAADSVARGVEYPGPEAPLLHDPGRSILGGGARAAAFAAAGDFDANDVSQSDQQRVWRAPAPALGPSYGMPAVLGGAPASTAGSGGLAHTVQAGAFVPAADMQQASSDQTLAPFGGVVGAGRVPVRLNYGAPKSLFQGAFADGGLAIGLSNFALLPDGLSGVSGAGAASHLPATVKDDEPGGGDDSSSHLLQAVLALTTD